MDNKQIHTIATAHLDTVWNWDFETTVSKYIPRTLNRNFKFFKKYPEYVFNFEGAYRYALMEEYYPKEFEKLKQYIKSGNWNPCGAGWENGDVNVPSPEALFRNFLLGNDYFEKKFGIRSRDVFLPDCFGFGYALPSIARHSNLYGFTTQKLSWGSAYGQPFDIGKWYGPDGNYIIANLKMNNYFSVLGNLRKSNAIKGKLSENEKHGLNATEVFHGVGDRGGGPLPLSVAMMMANIKKNGSSPVKVYSSPSDQLFRQIMTDWSEAQRDNLPSWNNELLLTNHGAGGYTSRAISKRWNRRGEELAELAERSAVAAAWLGTAEYPQEQLNTAWKRLIVHQFHDDLPGTSIQRVYLRSWNDYGLSLNQFAHEYEQSTAAVASMLDTAFCKGIPVIANNPIEAERRACVTAIIDASYKNVKVCDGAGKEMPSQVIENINGKTTIAFYAEMPPYSYSVYDVTASDTPCAVSTGLRVTDDSLENERYTVKLNANGDIGSVYDKELEKELLSAPVSLGIFDYTGSRTYPAWELKYGQVIRQPQKTARLVEKKIMEQGPARCAIRVVQQQGKTVFINNISLSAGADTVEVQCEFMWNHQKSLCKNIFCFTASNEEATFDLGLGAIKRGNAIEKMYEVPAQKWVDLTDKSGEYGVSVLSDCKYGWDKFNNNTLRMTVVHTPLNNFRITSMQSMMDLGLNRYGYAICAHKGGDVTRIQQAAREFSSPVTAFVCDKHKGVLGRVFGFARLNDSGIILRAVKKAENSNEIVVRVNEGVNKYHSDVKLTLGSGIMSAREIYASEEELGGAKVVDNALCFEMKPYEIRSFALKLLPCEYESTKPFEHSEMILPLNTKAITSVKNPSGHGIYGKNYTVPLEIIPETIVSGGVKFAVDKKNGRALQCAAQSVNIPAGCNKISILAASLDGDREFTFKTGKNDVKVKISDIEQRPFAWDLYSMKRTARIKTDVLGWECTHTHNEKGFHPAHQLFFFRYDIDTADASSITLPDDKNLLILSAAAIKNNTRCKCATLLYDTVKPREYDFKFDTLPEILNYAYRKFLGLFRMIL